MVNADQDATTAENRAADEHDEEAQDLTNRAQAESQAAEGHRAAAREASEGGEE